MLAVIIITGTGSCFNICRQWHAVHSFGSSFGILSVFLSEYVDFSC